MNKQPLISVIVPVYNVERHLKTCIDSILAQTYQNFEIILVDDGSPDGCPALCDAYSAQDERVRVVHKKNGGLSFARASGLAASCGEYIVFVDSDDFVHGRFLETLLDGCERYDADIAVASYLDVATDAVFSNDETNTSEEGCECVTGREAIERIYTWKWKNRTIAAWGKLYCRGIFDGVEFPNVSIHEDLAMTYKLLYRAKRVVGFDAALYFYRDNPSGLMAQRFSEQNLYKQLELIPIYQEHIQFYQKHKEYELLALLLRQCMDLYEDEIVEISKTNAVNRKNICKEFMQELRKNYWKLLILRESSLRNRLRSTKHILRLEMRYRMMD